ncbi:MAG: hemerythrin domain-containing protein [Desulfobacteraceae bacterium]|nr:hemerythrin domain-containing protein [Desulfobacteraceae bacterium]
MLGIISRFFKKQVDDSERGIVIDSGKDVDIKKHDSKAYVKVGKGNVAYHPALINELKQEHQELLNLFTKLVKSSRAGEKKETRSLLDTFKRRLISHVLRENVQFYVYVKYLLVDDPANSEFAKIMQQDMTDIGKTALDFIARSMEDTALYDSEFQNELSQIGIALTERIKIEEERLYGLYVHPDSVG